MNETRPCPYCAEEVRAEAIKCKHCGTFLAMRGSPNDWHRSTSDRMVAGVCGGLAQQFGVPTAVIRLAFVLMTFFAGGVGLLIYLVLWIVMPIEERDEDPDELRARIAELGAERGLPFLQRSQTIKGRKPPAPEAPSPGAQAFR